MKLKKCARIAIINKGNLIALDTKKLLDSIKTKKIIFKVKKINKIKEDLNGIKFSHILKQ